MNKDVDMGVAGSLTMILLVLATALLLRSFYKRYSRLQKREDDGQN
jgi:cobalamin synthase